MKKGNRDKERICTLFLKFLFLIDFLQVLLVRPFYAGELPWEISIGAKEVSQGEVVEIRVFASDLAEVKALWRDREMVFFPEGVVYSALLGVDLEERPGVLRITVEGRSKGGEKREGLITFRVREKAFPKENLKAPPFFDRIDDATLKRIENEKAQLDRLWSVTSLRRLWEGRFVQPVSGGITSPFGLRRIINGSARAPHAGVDLKAAMGSEVVAANHGQVVLREDFFFSGKSLVLDHGNGLYTMYFHLADFSVETNAYVRKGDLIARAGMTGRATGPHLHWGARLNGARVDPFQLVEATGNSQ
jgi:murein DD-endopeptidase MepM/ murein hydrolase activator NlpD